MKKQNVLFAVAGIFLGFFGGFFLANTLNRREILQSGAAAQSPGNAPFANQQTQAADIKPQQPGRALPEVAEKIDKARNEPTNFDAQVQAGNLYLQIKGVEKAQEFFERAAQLNPKQFDQIVKLGNGFFDAGQYEKAEKWYKQALVLKSGDVNVRTDLGITFVEREQPDFDRAIEEFRLALETNPQFEPAIYNSGIAHLKKGDRAGAEKLLSRLTEINPRSQAAEKLRQVISQN